MKVGAVVLTTGQRPGELAAALDSIRAQGEVVTRIVVVLNRDAEPGDDLTPGGDVEVLRPGENLGIPAGRNLGAQHLGAAVDLLLFLDDDARLTEDVLVRAVEAFGHDGNLGVVSMRLVDPDTGHTERRHVPRLRVGDPARSSWVTTFLGGASIVRADAYERAGGLPDAFFYAHEETSLAWRLIDQGWRIRYRGDLVVEHPGAPPSRHVDYHRLTARNRFLLGHLHLPLVVAATYVGNWTVLALLRAPRAWRATLGGLRDGWQLRRLARQPIRWRTIVRLARYGRPPIL